MKKYSHSTIDLARRFRRSPTETEEVLWKHLRGSALDGLKFKRQHRLGRYIVDFYCAELQLVVEGEIHDHNDQREYDIAKKGADSKKRGRDEQYRTSIEHHFELSSIIDTLSQCSPFSQDWERGATWLAGQGEGQPGQVT